MIEINLPANYLDIERRALPHTALQVPLGPVPRVTLMTYPSFTEGFCAYVCVGHTRIGELFVIGRSRPTEFSSSLTVDGWRIMQDFVNRCLRAGGKPPVHPEDVFDDLIEEYEVDHQIAQAAEDGKYLVRGTDTGGVGPYYTVDRWPLPEDMRHEMRERFDRKTGAIGEPRVWRVWAEGAWQPLVPATAAPRA